MDDGPQGIFNSRTLGIIARLTETLQQLKGVMEDDVDGLSTLKNIEGKGDLLDVKPFMTEVPETPEEIAALKKAVFRNEIFLGNIVSRDGKAAAIFAQFEDGIDKHAMYYTIKKIVDAERQAHPEVKIFFSGRPILEGLIGVLLRADMKRLFPIVMLVVLVVLFLTFRSVRGVVLPFAVVLASVFWTLGFMGLTGLPFFAISTVMPVILLAMGVADGIHILSAYHDQAYEHPDTPKRDLIMDTMVELWPPVVMTSITTAVGFSTLGLTSVVPFRVFGFMTAFGILAAMIFSLTVILALFIGAGNAQALTAKEIMTRTETWNKPDDETGSITITLINKRGKKRRRELVRYVQTDANKKDKSFLEFLKPADVRGTRFLTHEHVDRDDDRWMYLPALRKVRRISASDNTDNFMGTDLTFEDIRSEHLDTHDYAILREEKLHGREAYVIEAVPATPQERKESGYSKRHIWVDKATFLIMQEQFWNKKAEHIKTSKYADLKQLAPDIWAYNRIEVEHHKRKHRSIFVFGERKINTGLSDRIFSQRSLTRGK